MSGLKRRLGIAIRQTRRQANGSTQKPGYWQDTETIEREARELIEKTGALTWEVAAQYGKTTLFMAAKRYYPGGIKALKAKLNLGKISRPAGYWLNSENIEREAREVFEEEGNITQSLLFKHRKYGLTRGVKYYPGGWAGLKEKLGIASSIEAHISSEVANDQLRKLLER